MATYYSADDGFIRQARVKNYLLGPCTQALLAWLASVYVIPMSLDLGHAFVVL